jgi:hypothetical protein
MTTPRLSEAPHVLTADVRIDSEKIAKSESLSALFSYFKNWAPNDPSLKFKGSSVIKETDSEVAA